MLVNTVRPRDMIYSKQMTSPLLAHKQTSNYRGRYRCLYLSKVAAVSLVRLLQYILMNACIHIIYRK